MLGKHINHCEDSLTSAVFSHLFHLPVELWWPILRNASYTKELPLMPSEPIEVMPWPSWNPQGTRNSLRVVPDLFLRFTKFDLIIEAKRWDYQQQNESQWKDQLRAYITEYGNENKTIRLLALGGLRGKDDLEICVAGRLVLVHMAQWCRILSECQALRANLLSQRHPSSQSRAHVRTLNDIVELMAWHGFQKVAWFSDFAITSYRETVNAPGSPPIPRTKRSPMKDVPAQLDSALAEVRKAYRALHRYQRACLDTASYVGTQLGFEYRGGYPLLSNASPSVGKGQLENWAWDWLNLVYYDFYFTRQQKGQELCFLIRLFSDTGVFDAVPGTSREPQVSNFQEVERSQTVVGFLFYPKWQDAMEEFRTNAEQIRRFLKTGSELPKAWKNAGAVGMCCSFARISSPDSTDEVIEEIIAMGHRTGFAIERVAHS